jgi:hypothetical protein
MRNSLSGRSLCVARFAAAAAAARLRLSLLGAGGLRPCHSIHEALQLYRPGFLLPVVWQC